MELGHQSKIRLIMLLLLTYYNSVITCAYELWEFLPKDNKQIGKYSEEDVQRYKRMLPSDMKIACKSFGIN